MRKLQGFFVPVFLLASLLATGQKNVNLATALEQQQIKAVNRTLSIYQQSPEAVEMDAGGGDGLAILEEISFENGTVELELLGENNPGRSFIGLAFNIQDEETYEAIYFRPFNFVATEQARRVHMVQYICHPDYTWSRLREERTGEFENEITAPPDPDDWFKAIIEVSEKSVSVYLNDGEEPVLKVERLTGTETDRIGLWVGNGSSGRFRNLAL